MGCMCQAMGIWDETMTGWTEAMAILEELYKCQKIESCHPRVMVSLSNHKRGSYKCQSKIPD
jgi:hypothetical protein